MEAKIQCKDIPDKPILEFLKSLNGNWANWFEIDGDWDNPRSVRNAMPPNTNGNLALAKMRRLMKRGLVDGCDCGCRGDFEITEKGLEELNK